MVVRTLLIALVLLLFSCSGNVTFIAIEELPDSQWRYDQWVEFDFEENNSSTSQSIDIIVRHSPEFRHEKLLIEIRTIAPAGAVQINRTNHQGAEQNIQTSGLDIVVPTRQFWCDTIAIPLSGSDGAWIGRNMTTHFDLATNYRRNVHFVRPGSYNVRLRQLHDIEIVDGIMAVGLRITEQTDS